MMRSGRGGGRQHRAGFLQLGNAGPQVGDAWLELYTAGTVNLIGSGRDTAHEGRSHEGLCPSGHAGDLGPSLEGLGSGGSVLSGGDVVAAEVEEVVDTIMGGEKALGRAGRLEPLHLPLAAAGRRGRIPRSVVQMLWSGRNRMAQSRPEVTDGAPHAT